MTGWEEFRSPGRGASVPPGVALVALRMEGKKSLRLRLLGEARSIDADRVRLEVNRDTRQIALCPDEHGRKISRSKGGAYISVTGLDAVFSPGSTWALLEDRDGWIGSLLTPEGGES